MKTLELILDEDTAFQPLDYVLKKHLGLTKRQISQAKFREKGICINGEKQRISYVGRPGEILTVCLEEQETDCGKVAPLDGELEILYEDEDILAVNKPSGIACHPGRGHYRDSLGNLAAGLFEKRGEPRPVRIIGRLDRDTSGVVILAKNQTAGARLGEQKEKGIFQKEYLGIVKGRLENHEGRIQEPIGKIPGEKMKMQVDARGKRAETQYEVREFLDNATVTAWEIYTGRTHQIRVHMLYLGHPLIGDFLYNPGRELIGRQALHAWKLKFYHPITGKLLEFQADPPKDMAGLFSEF